EGSGVFDINPAAKEISMTRGGDVKVFSLPEAV
ncbi:MAG: hypothetical protein HW398_348, partial [Acidobacteria bacterium]|nr:hypothetical protein [Acidobacteriota bacterium]